MAGLLWEQTHSFFFPMNQLFYFLISFWLPGVFVALHRLFSRRDKQALLFIAGLQLLTAVASLIAELGGQGTQAQQLWYAGLAAPGHVESSQTRNQTCVPPLHWQVDS